MIPGAHYLDFNLTQNHIPENLPLISDDKTCMIKNVLPDMKMCIIECVT